MPYSSSCHNAKVTSLKGILFPSLLIIVLHPRKRLGGIVAFRGKKKKVVNI